MLHFTLMLFFFHNEFQWSFPIPHGFQRLNVLSRLMHRENIPQSGVAFSEEQEVYRSYILNLEKSIEWYNDVSIRLLIISRAPCLIFFYRFVRIAPRLN